MCAAQREAPREAAAEGINYVPMIGAAQEEARAALGRCTAQGPSSMCGVRGSSTHSRSVSDASPRCVAILKSNLEISMDTTNNTLLAGRRS